MVVNYDVCGNEYHALLHLIANAPLDNIKEITQNLSLDVEDSQGHDALSVVAMRERLEVMKWLMGRGLLLRSVSNRFGQNPVLVAI
jgi:hypothetical protein